MEKDKLKNITLSILFGILFMIVALIVQIIVQELPEIILIEENGIMAAEKIITNFEFSNSLVYAIFIGGTAAFFQEIMKLYAVKLKEKEYSLWIGIGFSIVDVSVLIIETFILSNKNLPFYEFIIIVLNVIFSFLFHPGTAMLLKYGILIWKIKIYFPIAFLFHLLIDGGLIFADIYVLKNPSSLFAVLIIFWIMVMSISIFVFLWGRISIKNKKIERFQ